MKLRHLLSIIVILSVTGATVAPTFGQTWSDEQLEVLNIIEAQWNAAVEKDISWPDKYLHPNFLGWNHENPMPRDKSSIQKWDRFNSENSTTLLYELYPVG
ncbi:MAG: hypothetical protein ACXACR_15510, partial [Candidatus Hodarchaeales archaeon]